MKVIILGDIHSKWKIANAILNYELSPEETALSVGDLCNYQFAPQKNQKLLFVHGNHEAFEYIRELHAKKEALYPIYAGEVYRLSDGTTVAGLPGIYSPRFFKASEKPLRYYSEEDIRALLNLSGIDILLTHEAPSGIDISIEGEDVGKKEVTDIIESLHPRVAFFGHHHRHFERQLNGTKVYGIEQPHHAYYLLNTEDFSVTRISATMKDSKIGYRYDWMKGNGK